MRAVFTYLSLIATSLAPLSCCYLSRSSVLLLPSLVLCLVATSLGPLSCCYLPCCSSLIATSLAPLLLLPPLLLFLVATSLGPLSCCYLPWSSLLLLPPLVLSLSPSLSTHMDFTMQLSLCCAGDYATTTTARAPASTGAPCHISLSQATSIYHYDGSVSVSVSACSND